MADTDSEATPEGSPVAQRAPNPGAATLPPPLALDGQSPPLGSNPPNPHRRSSTPNHTKRQGTPPPLPKLPSIDEGPAIVVSRMPMRRTASSSDLPGGVKKPTIPPKPTKPLPGVPPKPGARSQSPTGEYVVSEGVVLNVLCYVDQKERAVSVNRNATVEEVKNALMVVMEEEAKAAEENFAVLSAKLSDYTMYREICCEKKKRLCLLSPSGAAMCYSLSKYPDRLVYKPRPSAYTQSAGGTIMQLQQQISSYNEKICVARDRCVGLVGKALDNALQELEEVMMLKDAMSENLEELQKSSKEQVLFEGYMNVRTGISRTAPYSKRYLTISNQVLRVFKKKGDSKAIGYAGFTPDQNICITTSLQELKKFIVMFEGGTLEGEAGEHYPMLQFEGENEDVSWDWIDALSHASNSPPQLQEPVGLRKTASNSKSKRERRLTLRATGEEKRKPALESKSSLSQSLTDLKPLGPHFVPMTCKSFNVFTEAYPPGTGFEMKKVQAEGSRLFTYQLSSGSLEDLVATLIFHSAEPQEYLYETFGLMIGLHNYCTPEEFGACIQKVWKRFADRGFQCAGEERLRKRLLNLGTQICAMPPFVLEGTFDDSIKETVAEVITGILGKSTEVLKCLQPSFKPLPSLQHDNAGIMGLKESNMNKNAWYDYDATSLAEQLTVWEASMFRGIQLSELLKTRWQKRRDLAQNLNQLSNRFNHVSDALSTGILYADGPKVQVKLFKKMVRVVKKLLALRNYSSAFQIWTGLTHFTITRLSWIKEVTSTSEKTGADLAYFSTLFNPSDNYKTYRAQSFASPCLPAIAVTLRDLTFMEENPHYKEKDEEKVINFDRWRMIANAILSLGLQDASTTAYSLPFDTRFHRLLTKSPVKSGDEMYAKSQQLEAMKSNKPIRTMEELDRDVTALQKELRVLKIDVRSLKPDEEKYDSDGAEKGDTEKDDTEKDDTDRDDTEKDDTERDDTEKDDSVIDDDSTDTGDNTDHARDSDGPDDCTSEREEAAAEVTASAELLRQVQSLQEENAQLKDTLASVLERLEALERKDQ